MKTNSNSKKKEPKARFIDQFNINEADWTICLNAQLCCTIAIFEKLLKAKSISYKELGISSTYYKKFKTAIIQGIKTCVDDLQRYSKIISLSDYGSDYDMDYNTLDYLEGLIKSAVDNGLIKWHEIGFDNSDIFNELLENIRWIIDACTTQNFLEPEDSNSYTGLRGFEADGKINGDYNEWSDDCIVRDPALIKKAQQLTEIRVSDEEQICPMDDSELDIICERCLGSIPYISIKLPIL